MMEKITGTRSKQRFFLYFGIVIWLLIINIWLFYTYHSRNKSNFNNLTNSLEQSSIYNQYDESNLLEEQQKLKPEELEEEESRSKTFKEDLTIKLLQKQQSKLKDVRGIDAHASVYNKIFKNHNIDSVFANLNFQQRCDLFFQNLFIEDKNWIFKINEKLHLENKAEFSFNDYRNHYLDEYKKQWAEQNHKNKDEADNNPDFEAFVKTKYDEFWTRTMEYEQKIVDHLSILRVFNKCYLTSDNSTQIKQTNEFIQHQHKFINGIYLASRRGEGIPDFKYTKEENLINFKSIKHTAFEHRVYPWLSFENPIFERFTGTVLYKPPQMSKYITDGSQATNKDLKESNQLDFFLNRFKNSCNGKGIVLSIGDSHVEDTVKLIHLLRTLNNKLPIQIVYYDDLSVETKKLIVTAAREEVRALPKSFQKVKHHFPEDYLTSEKGLPAQEIWFVNTYNVIHDDFKDKFKGYANKFLATFFNSFEEFMLIDADTVMMQTPEYFFNLEGYIKTGTFFYKDRTTFESRPKSDAMFFKKLGPSIVDSVMFDIPIMTNYTCGNEFMNGMYHYQESGLVMINRNIHFNSLLMMLQLNFYEPINGRIHGDKEIFWLAMAINGDENYIFNKNFAAAIGKKTPTTERSRPDGSTHKSTELCSPHPGHISDQDNALVWINSGFYYCSKAPKIDWEKEVKHQSRLKFLKDIESFKTFYYSPLRINSAIIPPIDLNLWAINKDDEPSRGWFMDSRYCNGYMWCAYSGVGGTTDDGESNYKAGKLYDFSEKEQDLFNFYGDVWVGLE
ncbi:hypothetical protein KGF54_002267 [Candida jiufengensis]|uniref:uncharacterized protein n=1 Tax=Candida jiufengensis TaxID=497108 RepID=UPI0022247A35|nr:uncharacterized protein KGF54_002267 [Candida jiufengensis]KAI5954492.1 hypothetical protein KGF54_002267 [Candida jiufengensis]